MNDFWDPDIANMMLTDVEKNGLQVFRNYSQAIDEHRRKAFAARSDGRAFDTAPFSRVLELVKNEDPRFLPVIASSFIDEQLKDMFKRDIPEGVPGGRAELLNGFGPLSRFSQRLQIAFAFGWMSEDLLQDADKLRKIRNDISHKWDLGELAAKLDNLIDERLSPIEEHLEDQSHFPKDYFKDIDRFTLLRVRLVWLLGRIFYEANLYAQALKDHLDPAKALYGKERPRALEAIADQCVKATKEVVMKAKSNKALQGDWPRPAGSARA